MDQDMRYSHRVHTSFQLGAHRQRLELRSRSLHVITRHPFVRGKLVILVRGISIELR